MVGLDHEETRESHCQDDIFGCAIFVCISLHIFAKLFVTSCTPVLFQSRAKSCPMARLSVLNRSEIALQHQHFKQDPPPMRCQDMWLCSIDEKSSPRVECSENRMRTNAASNGLNSCRTAERFPSRIEIAPN